MRLPTLSRTGRLRRSTPAFRREFATVPPKRMDGAPASSQGACWKWLAATPAARIAQKGRVSGLCARSIGNCRRRSSWPLWRSGSLRTPRRSPMPTIDLNDADNAGWLERVHSERLLAFENEIRRLTQPVGDPPQYPRPWHISTKVRDPLNATV